MARRGRVAARLLALGIGLAGGEVAARLWFRSNGDLHWRVNAESVWRLAWIGRQHRDIEVYRRGIDRFDPLLGWRNAVGFANEEPILESEVVTTNALGARGGADVPYERTGRPRVVVVGDSFTFGWGVDDDETYAAHLARALPAVEVVNLGVGGYGTDQMLLMLREEGLRYEPDLIVVGVVSADTERNLVAFRDFAKPRFELNEGGLRLRDTPVPTPAEVLAGDRWRPRVADLVDVIATLLGERSGARPQRADELTVALWSEMQRIAGAAGAATLFVYAPINEEISAGNPTACEELVLGFAERTRADVLNLRPEFRARVDAGERFRSGHWGPPGHAVIGEALARAIRERGLLDS